jgi:hypothetical protein
MAAIWVGLIAFDVLVFCLTAKKAMEIKASVGQHSPQHLWDTILYDGESCELPWYMV